MSDPKLRWRHALYVRPRLNLGLLLALALLLAAMRALGALGPPLYRPLLPLGFVLMALLPWLLLTSLGRQQAGWAKAAAPGVYLWAAVSGAVLALLIGALGSLWFGATPQNWYISVWTSFQSSFDPSGKPVWLLFAVFTTAAMLFSPIGEEIFFRGFLQRSLQDWLSERWATHLECGVFALVHLCHHGLHWQNGTLALWWPSALVWMALMFGVARLFAHWRTQSGSVWPAVVSHMAFNGAMGGYIFTGM